jgi:LPS export ABC transporter protein LptC/lipopolysaccharide transport protein LptA
MTPASVRLLQRALLGTVVVVTGLLIWTWRGNRQPPPPAAASGPPPSPGASAPARTENLVFRSFKGDKLSYSMSAREQVGQEGEEQHLRGVEFVFSYVSQKQPGTGTIKASSCLYNPTLQKALFEGAVVLTTADGFELKTEALAYRGDKEQARSEAPVEFKRGGLSGRSTGLTYQSQDGRLELPKDVYVRTEAAQGPPTEITAQRAELIREQGTMRFMGTVQVLQGDQKLESDTFEVDFGEDRVIYRARAVENVKVAMGAGPLPGTTAAPTGARGPRQLSCRKLDMWFRPDGGLREATATQDALLVIFPARGEPEERRRLRSDVIQFLFNETGGLGELRTARGTFFEAAPLNPKKKGALPVRTLSCQRLLAKMNPVGGDVSVVEFEGNLVFAQGRQKAVAQKAYFDGKDRGLYLMQEPELIDEEQGSHLRAQAIEIAANGNLAAREEVRHVVRRPGHKGAGLLGGAAPLQISAKTFAYEEATKTGRYTERALLRAGTDEVRAGTIELQEKDGQRRLEARGEVVALLHPQGEGQQGQPVDARAEEMRYDEAQRRLSFRGQSTIHQGVMDTKSPEATITFDETGAGMQSLVAGSPVEMTYGARKASGSRATYEPQAGRLNIVGEKVRMKDPEQEVEGRSLTLDLRDDRILVDGQEQVRTQTIFRGRKDAPRP